MSFQATCPECGASYDLADRLQGKTIRCENCQSGFKAVVDENDEKVRPSSAKGRRRNSDNDDEVRPRKSKGMKSKKNEKGNGLIIGAIVGAITLAAGAILIIVLAGKKPADQGGEKESAASRDNATGQGDVRNNPKDADPIAAPISLLRALNGFRSTAKAGP